MFSKKNDYETGCLYNTVEAKQERDDAFTNSYSRCNNLISMLKKMSKSIKNTQHIPPIATDYVTLECLRYATKTFPKGLEIVEELSKQSKPTIVFNTETKKIQLTNFLKIWKYYDYNNAWWVKHLPFPTLFNQNNTRKVIRLS